jgi:hypothetical protein
MIYIIGLGTVVSGILIVSGLMLAYALFSDPKDSWKELKKCIKEVNERKANESKN